MLDIIIPSTILDFPRSPWKNLEDSFERLRCLQFLHQFHHQHSEFTANLSPRASEEASAAATLFQWEEKGWMKWWNLLLGPLVPKSIGVRSLNGVYQMIRQWNSWTLIWATAPPKKDFAQLCTYDFGMFFWSPWFFGSTNHPGEGHNFWGKCHFPPSPGVPSCWFGWPPGISLRISTAGCKTSSASRASSTCGWTRRTSRSSAGCLNGCWCWCTRRCINPRWTSGWLVGWGRLVLSVLVWCWGWMWRGLLVVVSFFGQGPKGMEKMLQSGDFWWGKPMIQSKIDWRTLFPRGRRLKERWDNLKMTICWGDGSWPERNVDIEIRISSETFSKGQEPSLSWCWNPCGTPKRRERVKWADSQRFVVSKFSVFFCLQMRVTPVTKTFMANGNV